jgi:hypothetical protein
MLQRYPLEKNCDEKPNHLKRTPRPWGDPEINSKSNWATKQDINKIKILSIVELNPFANGFFMYDLS